MHRARRISALVAAVCLAVTAPLLADEVFFKNGDRLSGKILRMEDGRMTFKSSVAGELSFKLTDLESFKSDTPLAVRLPEGATTRATVTDAEEGRVIVGQGTPAARTLPTQQIKAINPKDGWSGSFAAGLLIARGNTDTDNAHATVEAEKRWIQDRFTLGSAYLFGRQRDPDTGDTTTTTDTWHVRGKFDHFFSEKFYGYGNLRVEQDNIARLDLRLTPGFGLGYQFVERDDFRVSTEAGLTYVYERFEPSGDADETEFRERNEYLSARLAYKIEKQFNDRFTLFHDAEYFPSFQDLNDFLVNANAGLRVSLINQLFLEYKFTVVYDSVPAPGADRTDLRHLLSVGWKF